MAKVQSDDFDENVLFEKAAIAGNPLAKYFRMPGFHVRLPTNGVFLPKGAVTFTMAGEIPVYPMRAADEILMKSPDALMSGYALEKMLESCVPDIKTPRLISTPDLDVLLLAVRAASYGETMQIETVCPNCGNQDHFDCSLPAILSTVKDEPIDNEVRLTDQIVVYLRPYTLDVATRVSLTAFQEARKVQALDATENEDAKQAGISESFRRLTDLNITMMAESIVKVVIPEGTVTDPRQIAEFIGNAPTAWTKKIDAKLKDLNAMGMDKGIDVECSNCHHKWRTEVEFDPTSFFDLGS